MSERIQAAKQLLADEIRDRAPLVSASHVADGYAIYFVDRDGRLASAEYGNESARHLEDLDLVDLTRVLAGAEDQADAIRVAMGRCTGTSDTAFSGRVCAEVMERLPARPTIRLR